jgi:hypothetical protein
MLDSLTPKDRGKTGVIKHTVSHSVDNAVPSLGETMELWNPGWHKKMPDLKLSTCLCKFRSEGVLGLFS